MFVNTSFLKAISDNIANLSCNIKITLSDNQTFVLSTANILTTNLKDSNPANIELNTIVFENLNQINSNILFYIAKGYILEKNISLASLLSSGVNIDLISDTQNDKHSVTIYRGFVNSVIDASSDVYRVTIHSLMSKLSTQKGDFFSETCRAQLGDSKCRVNLSYYQTTGAIQNIVSSNIILGNHSRRENNYCNGGSITITSGALNGQTLQVNYESNGYIYLVTGYEELRANDTYILSPGCNKTTAMCTQRFNNIINFRGEPFIN